MKKIGEPKQYCTGRTFAIGLLILGLFFCEAARAQDCNPAKQRIYRITETQARQVADSLQTLLNLAVLVRECEEDVSTELELWLLNNEVFALNSLEHYREARQKVDHFFEIYFEDAPDYYRARFYLWRLHLAALSGNGISMVTDYAEAQRYAHALDPARRAHLYANGAYVYLKINENQAALRLTKEALQLIATPETYDERTAVARALLLGAEAQLHLGLPSPLIERALLTASGLYREFGDSAKVALARTLLGMTHAAEGDTSRAFAELAEGVHLAQQSGSQRSVIMALYRQGQVLRRWGQFAAAEASLLQAEEVAETMREFYVGIVYELALLYEQHRQLAEAARYYQAVVDAPKPSDFLAALKAQRQADAAQIRLLLLASEQKQRRLHLALGGLLLLVALASGGLVYLWQRPRRLANTLRAKSNGSFIPRRLSTGLTLDQLTAHFRKQVNSALFGLHLAYIFATLFQSELILPYLDDPWLIKHVEDDSLPSNAALFRCVAAAEEALVEGQRFGKDPANTIGSYLNGEFKKRSETKPANPSKWKQYFVEHHVEELLRLSRAGGASSAA